MNTNKARYTIRVVSPRGKVTERGTRCTNQETGHRVARDIARDAEYTKVRRVELVDPSGEVVERFTINKAGNLLEVLNGASVQAVMREMRARAAAEKAAAAKPQRTARKSVRTVKAVAA